MMPTPAMMRRAIHAKAKSAPLPSRRQPHRRADRTAQAAPMQSQPVRNAGYSSCHVGADRLCRTIHLSILAHRMSHTVGERRWSDFPRISHTLGLLAGASLNFLPVVTSYGLFLSFKRSSIPCFLVQSTLERGESSALQAVILWLHKSSHEAHLSPPPGPLSPPCSSIAA